MTDPGVTVVSGDGLMSVLRVIDGEEVTSTVDETLGVGVPVGVVAGVVPGDSEDVGVKVTVGVALEDSAKVGVKVVVGDGDPVCCGVRVPLKNCSNTRE